MIEIQPEELSTAERIRSPLGVGYFPVLATTADNALLCVYRAGGGHGGRGGYLISVRSEDAGHTWSDPVTVVKTKRYDDRNPAIGVAENGVVTVAYFESGVYGGDDLSLEDGDRRNPEEYWAGLVHSFDNGLTWSEPKNWTDATFWGQKSPYGSMITLSDGTMAMPIYWTYDTHLIWSHNNGWTWGEPTLVSESTNEVAYCVLPGTDEKEWLALGRRHRRDNDDEAALMMMRSSDCGRTWRDTGLFIPGLRYPADMAVLSDSSIICAYGYRDQPEGARACRILDNGTRWSEHELVVHDKAPNFDTGYASVAVQDGWVVIVFYDADGGDVYEYDKAFCEAVRVREDELIAALDG